jgi:hypothetical protein
MGPAREPEEPKATKVSEEDRLKSENLHLRCISINHERSILALQLREKERVFVELAQELGAFKAYLAAKYDIDFATHQIQDNTGEIVPRQAPPTGVAG